MFANINRILKTTVALTHTHTYFDGFFNHSVIKENNALQ